MRVVPPALLLSALACAPAASWGLDFAPCTEPGHEAFDCATVTVPLDRSGTVPGTVALAVERLRQQGAARPVVVALAGGPGQSATAFDAIFAQVFRQALDRYQLVVFDQRGTGRSGALDCPALTADFSARDIAECGATLGPAAEFYTTADSVLDLDDVRAALGVDVVVLAGISYGTHVALEYARTFPARTAALVLDSTLPPDGNSPFDADSLGASHRVLGDLCAAGACAGITADPVGDTAVLVRRLARRPLRGPVIGPDGKRGRGALDAATLFRILEAGDLRPVLQARYPGAVVAARRGDRAPLLRLALLGALAGAGEADAPLREDSPTLRLATACADIRFPWAASDPPELRAAALEAVVRAVPPAALFPFDQTTALHVGSAPSCLYWPITSLARATSGAPFPDVRALVLGGTRDVRTPLENLELVAGRLPHATAIVVPNRGHSLLTGPACARASAAEFLLDLPVLDHCAGLAPRFATERPPPRTLARVRRVAGLPSLPGRVLRAVVETLDDALDTAVTVFRRAGVELQAGGLRAGRLTGSADALGIHLLLQGYALVPGVSVSGSVDTTATTLMADVRVRGALSGALQFGADGSLTGTLGGRRLSGSLGHAVARAAARARAHAAELPPIP